jgi:hypothetical protein
MLCPVPVGSSQKLYLKLSWATDSVYWKLISKNTGFLKHMENKIKPLAVRTKFKKNYFMTWK